MDNIEARFQELHNEIVALRDEFTRQLQIATIRHQQEMTAIFANQKETARMLDGLEAGWAEFRHNMRNQ